MLELYFLMEEYLQLQFTKKFYQKESAPTFSGALSGNASTATTASNSNNLGGKPPQDAVGANTIPTRDGNGYSYFNYINSNTGNSENPTVSQVIVTNGGDGFYRKASVAHLTSSLSGTAPINISGRAAGCTFSQDSVDRDNITTRVDSGFYETSSGTTAEGWPITNNSYQHMIACTHSNDANYYSMQLAASFFNNELFYRSTNGNGSTGWVTMLASNNYNSYAPTLTGSGASGTWGISISGSAAQLGGYAASTYIGKFGSGSGYYQADNWVQFNTSNGLYWPSFNAAEWSANVTSTYSNFRMVGSRNSYDGIYSVFSGVNGLMFDSGGNGGAYREANGRWYWYYNLGNDCMGIGTSNTSSTYSLFLNKGIYAQSRIDATIFYEVNNTGYYFDPAGSTSMRTVGDWRSDDTGWTGEFAGKIQYHASIWFFQSASGHQFRNSGGSQTMFVDSNGNLTATTSVSTANNMTVGSTISGSWSTSWKAVQMGTNGSVSAGTFSVFRSVALAVNAAGASTTNPLVQNYIETNARAGMFQIVPSSGTTNVIFYWRGGPTGGTAGTQITWSTPMTLDASGYLLIGYLGSNGAFPLQVNGQIFATSATIATSDARYKEDVQSLDGALDVIKALRPVQFKWKKHDVHNFNTDIPTIGFLAQEVQQVLADKPYLHSIVKSSDCILEEAEKDEDENVIKEAVTEEFLGIAESNLVALLTRAMQEQNAEVVDLRSRIATLEALVLNLTGK